MVTGDTCRDGDLDGLAHQLPHSGPLHLRDLGVSGRTHSPAHELATAAALVDQWDSVSARSLDGGVVALEATDRALAPWQRFLRTGVSDAPLPHPVRDEGHVVAARTTENTTWRDEAPTFRCSREMKNEEAVQFCNRVQTDEEERGGRGLSVLFFVSVVLAGTRTWRRLTFS